MDDRTKKYILALISNVISEIDDSENPMITNEHLIYSRGIVNGVKDICKIQKMEWDEELMNQYRLMLSKLSEVETWTTVKPWPYKGDFKWLK